MVNRWSVLLRTEVSSGVLAAMAAHLNELVCPNPVLLRKVAENLLDPLWGREDKKATRNVFVRNVAVEKTELEVDVMKEGFQVSGENVEANSQTSGNPE